VHRSEKKRPKFTKIPAASTFFGQADHEPDEDMAASLPAEDIADEIYEEQTPVELVASPVYLAPDVLISVDTWMTPMPTHSKGLLVYYGPQWLIQANADYRGYDLSPYNNRCGVSAISPSDIGKVVWLRVETDWFGPCLTIDVGARHDYPTQVYKTGEIAEVADWMRDMFRFPYGSSRPGEVYVGLCPPAEESQARFYRPEPAWSPEPSPLFHVPPQQYPIDCET
jgi:hypothetical protein